MLTRIGHIKDRHPFAGNALVLDIAMLLGRLDGGVVEMHGLPEAAFYTRRFGLYQIMLVTEVFGAEAGPLCHLALVTADDPFVVPVRPIPTPTPQECRQNKRVVEIVFRNQQRPDRNVDVPVQFFRCLAGLLVPAVEIEQLDLIDEGVAQAEEVFLFAEPFDMCRFVVSLTGQGITVFRKPFEVQDKLGVLHAPGGDEGILYDLHEFLIFFDVIEDIVKPVADHKAGVGGGIHTVPRIYKIPRVQGKPVGLAVKIEVIAGMPLPVVDEKGEGVVNHARHIGILELFVELQGHFADPVSQFIITQCGFENSGQGNKGRGGVGCMTKFQKGVDSLERQNGEEVLVDVVGGRPDAQHEFVAGDHLLILHAGDIDDLLQGDFPEPAFHPDQLHQDPAFPYIRGYADPEEVPQGLQPELDGILR
ncbi:hypothetical protein ES708_12991 [subsurface metagenome]